MATVAYANFGIILLALQTQVASATGIDPTRVIITVLDADEVPHWDAVQDVLIRPGAERPDVGIIDGAGRYDNRRIRDVQVIAAHAGLILDMPGSDVTRLTDQALGHLAIEDQIVDCLEMFFPLNANQDALTLPIRCTTLSMSRRSPGRGRESGWVSSVWDLQIEYARNLSNRVLGLD